MTLGSRHVLGSVAELRPLLPKGSALVGAARKSNGWVLASSASLNRELAQLAQQRARGKNRVGCFQIF